MYGFTRSMDELIPTDLANLIFDGFSKAIKESGETYTRVSKSFQEFQIRAHLELARIALYEKYYKKYVLEHCPNKKVVHLTKYCKKERIRKKNFHRAMKIVEKIEKENW